MHNRALLYSSLALAAAFGVLQVLYVGMTNDTNMFMHDAYQMLRHRGFYEHSIDVNPPLYVMLDVPMVLIAECLHIHPGYILHAFCFATCILSLISLHHVLRVHAVNERERNLWLAISALALLVSPILFGVYADRDHLLFILTLPWITQMLLRVKPLTYTCAFAAIGFCIKPYDAILFIAMTLAAGPQELSFRQRMFSTSACIIAGAIAGYWLAIALIFPFYIHGILPVALLTYSSVTIDAEFHNPFLLHKQNNDILFAVFVFITVSQCMLKLKNALPWYALLLSCFIVYNLNAGWDYTTYLLFFPCALFSILPFCTEQKNLPNAKNANAMFICISLGCIYFSILGLINTIRFNTQQGYGFTNQFSHRVYTELRESVGEKFIPVSALFWGSNIETIGQAPKCVFAYTGYWPLHWLYLHPTDPRFMHVLQTVTTPLVAAMENNPSATLIVDTSPDLALYPPKDLLTFLRQDPKLRNLLSNYEQFKTIDDCSAWKKRECSYALLRMPLSMQGTP